MRLAHKLAHISIPRESNNFRASLLGPLALIQISVIFLFLQFTINSAPKIGVDVLGYAANISNLEVINLTNQKRAEFGQSPLQENTALSQAAFAKGKHMLENDYWAHVAPDGTEPWAFFSQVDYNYRYAGENLARDFSNAGSAVEAWMASPTHRENMLSSRYREIGIAVVEGDLNGVDTTIIVQLLGARVDTIPAIPVAAAEKETVVAEAVPAAAAAPQLDTENRVVAASERAPITSPFNVVRAMSIGVVALLLGLLAIDSIVVYRQGVARIGSRSAAHFTFLGVVLVILWIVRAGTII